MDKAFNEAWPEIQKHGHERGWLGIAEAAWRAAIASQEAAPSPAAPATCKCDPDGKLGLAAAPEQAVDALGIKTWRQRCDWESDEPATKLMVDAMKAEIAELRAALSAQQKAAPICCNGNCNQGRDCPLRKGGA